MKRYQIRHGGRTIDSRDTEASADTAAYRLSTRSNGVVEVYDTATGSTLVQYRTGRRVFEAVYA